MGPFLAGMQIPYRTVLGNAETQRLFRVVRIPAILLIARDGRIAAFHMGVVDRKRFEALVEELTGSRTGA